MRTKQMMNTLGQRVSWKKYWKIFTLQDFPNVCPFCGLPMSEDEVEGCHIKVKGRLTGELSTKEYIIPGHHECNMQSERPFSAKITLYAVEAIER